MQLYYIHRIFITNLLHDVFSCINDCSDMFMGTALSHPQGALNFINVYSLCVKLYGRDSACVQIKIKILKSLKSFYG